MSWTLHLAITFNIHQGNCLSCAFLICLWMHFYSWPPQLLVTANATILLWIMWKRSLSSPDPTICSLLLVWWSAPIHLLQTIHGFIILHNIHSPRWSCPIFSPYLEAFLWFFLRDVRSSCYLQQLRSRTPPAWSLDPSLVHLGGQGFCPGLQVQPAANVSTYPPTYTHTPPTH